jgi:type II secretory pathway pseudopilin PulG
MSAKINNTERSEMQPRAGRSLRAFTLVETLVAVLIFTIIAAGLMAVFSMSLHAWKEGGMDISLQSSGRLIIEKIVRGPAGLFGLREAGEGDVTVDTDGRGITFLVDQNTDPTFSRLDDTEVRIYFQEDKIIYDPSSEFVGDELPIVSFGKVEDVLFEVSGSTVNVELWMRDTSGDVHPSKVKLQTKVFLRKSRDPDRVT